MKIPFSYKDRVFGPVLFASFLGHLTLVGFGSFFSPDPKYAVEQAPSSMEVVIVNERHVKEEKKVIQEGIISAKDPLVEAPEVIQKKKEELKKELPKKSIYIPPVRGAVTEPRPSYLKNPAPVYPEYARRQGWEGVVILKVLVNGDGTVGRIAIGKSSGYKILDQSAFNTIRTWRFLPARVGDLSFSSWIQIPVRFVLVEEKRS